MLYSFFAQTVDKPYFEFTWLNIFLTNIFGGIFFSYYIQHCFICRPSDSTVPTDAGIESKTVATGALAVYVTQWLTVGRSNH